MMEGEAAYEPPTYSYDEVFPALPESAPGAQASTNQLGQWNNKMRVGSSVVTQVFRVPYEERKLDHSERFGEGDSLRTCSEIMDDTGAHIEISMSKDQSLTFLVTGKHNAVLEARRKILTHFQTQASVSISIPKEYHRFILGKSGNKLKELEKTTATKISVPPVADVSDKITITGTKEGIDKAMHEIRVTSDEQSKQAYERLVVPKIYHPFIAGAHNENVNAIMADYKIRVNIPPLSVQKDEITIAGEKEGVMAAKEKIMAIYQEMSKKCHTVSVEVSKSQHKYVIGPRGSTIAEILQETGVSVEMPPSDTPTDTITLRGPHDKLGQALHMVYQKANSVRTTSVEAPAWIHKYIIGRKGANIKQMTQDLPKVHVEFTDKEDKIRIEGPPEEVDKAQKDLEEMARDLVQKLTFEEIAVDPKYYKHIIGKSGANVNRLKEETGVVINITDGEGSNIIRIEGKHAGVATAKKELEDMVHKLENEKERDIIIDRRFYKSIIGSKGEKIKEVREKFNQVQITIPGPGEKRDIVKIRGSKEDVDKCYKHMQKMVKELGESSYVLEVPIYKQFHKYIIGKGGANIRKIRDETQARIDLPTEGDKSDVIIITGKKENAEEARDKIQKIQNDMANIVSEEITIPPKFYNSLIGAGGKLIHSIMEECGGVIIKFPPADSSSDKVTIRGPKDDVEKAKQQLLELTTERQLSSYSDEVRARPQHHKFLIGRNGVNIKKIRDMTGARIMFPTDKDEDKELITIIGKKEAVEKAKAELEATIKEIDNIVESDMHVDPKYHRHFVARQGNILHQIADQYGGVMISFPRAGVASDRVVLKGAKDCVEGAKQRIQEIVHDLENQVTIECVIPQRHHRTVMGAKGFKVQGITQEYEVQIKFPDRDVQGSEYEDGQQNGELEHRACDVIRITGQRDHCEAAKQALLDLVPVTLEVDVPYEFHRSIIGQKGRDVRDLMNTYDVHIVLSPADQKLNMIKITGTPQCVQNAKKAVEERCKQLEQDKADKQLKSFELKLEVDPDFHPKIIGKRGAVITKIRTDHDVQINFPKKGDPEEHTITITGYEANAVAARNDIMSIVDELNKMVKDQVSIDHRVHARLIGQRGRAIHKVMEQYSVDIKFPRPTDPDPSLVAIIGSEDNVADAKEYLLNLAEEYIQDMAEMLELEQYTRHGRNSGDDRGGDGGAAGAQGFVVKDAPWDKQSTPPQATPNTSSIEDFPSFEVNRLKNKTGVMINNTDGEGDSIIRIEGKHAGVATAKKANIVSEEITIPPKFYNSLIGAGGKLIHSIMEECGGVIIKFPPADSSSDKVTIRGPKDDVEKAKQQLLELTTERQLSSYSDEVRARPQHHKFLIGRNGVNIKKIRDMTGARIMFPTDKDEDKELITIIGKKEAVEKAKVELEANIKKIDNIVESDMHVDPKYHRHFVTRQGNILHQIADQYGGVMISFPRAGVASDRVVLKGAKDCVEGAKQRIQEIVHDLENQVTIECVIPQRHHRTVMGAKGFKVQGITQEYEVQIKFPDRDVQGSEYENGQQNGELEHCACDVIHITGQLDHCEAAKQALLDLVPVTLEVDVPYEFHRSIIGQKGRDVRDLMNTYDVHIVLSPADQKLNMIKITGTPQCVQNAKKAVEERCKQLEQDKADKQLKSFELKLEVDPDFHPKIVGKRGAVITKIRKDHDVKIKLPKKGDPEEHTITITGCEANAMAARDDIMSIVDELNKMVKEQVSIDPRFHARLIGRKGRAIYKVMEQYSVDIKFAKPTDPDPSLVAIIGSEDNVADAKEYLLNLAKEYLYENFSISFSRAGVSSDLVVLKGAKDCVEGAKQHIQEVVHDLENQVTIECVIPQRHHRTVMGAKGFKVQGITQEYEVQIKFPDRDMQGSDGQQNGELEHHPCDVIRITGQRDQCEAAKQVLLDLVPVTIKVDVPYEFHGFIIGRKGRYVRDLMNTYGVHIVLSPADQKLNMIKITGTPQCVQNAKKAVEERCKQLEQDKADKQLKSFELKLEVDPDFHPKIIGKRGAVITKIRTDHDVRINFPKKGDPEEHTITITGYEANAVAARNDIMSIVDALEKKMVSIDQRVLARLMGSSGRAFHKVMRSYHVKIKFPRSIDPDPSAVAIMGSKDNVADAKEYLLNLAEEYIQDMAEVLELEQCTQRWSITF